MTIDRNRLEQEALRLLQKGQNERALERYLTLLRDKPKDLRVRQQVADLYLKLGQNPKAEQHLREIAKVHRASGTPRAAIGVYKQILRIKPDDHTLYGELGECYQTAGFPKEAMESFEKVVSALAKYNPDKAVPYLQRLIALQPGVLPVQVRLAELYEAANWAEKAQSEWRRLAREARRYGALDDRARFLVKALSVRENAEIAREAAEAWIDVGDYGQALPLLQAATEAGAQDADTLTLLARCLTGLGAKEQAIQVWRVVAEQHQVAGNAAGRAVALRGAIEAGASDPSLQAEVEKADQLAALLAMRLTEQAWAQPTDDAAGEWVVKASVYLQYRQPQLAVDALRGLAGNLARNVGVKAALAEALVDIGDTEGALAVLTDIVPPHPLAAEHIRLRASVLRGEGLSTAAVPAGVDADDLLDDGLMDDELIDDEPTDPGPEDAPFLDDELLDDELIDDEPTAEPASFDDSPGFDDGAFAPSDSSDDLSDDDGLGSLFGDEPEDAPPPVDEEDDGLASLFGAAFSEPAPTPPAPRVAPPPPAAPMPVAGPLADVAALIRVCAWERAEGTLGNGDSLTHALLRAQIRRGQGDLSGALAVLREAVADAGEDDVSYLPSLLEMAELNVATGKSRAAVRLLDEIEDIGAPALSAGVAMVRRAIELTRS